MSTIHILLHHAAPQYITVSCLSSCPRPGRRGLLQGGRAHDLPAPGLPEVRPAPPARRRQGRHRGPHQGYPQGEVTFQCRGSINH